MDDEWLEKEDNGKLQDTLFSWLTSEENHDIDWTRSDESEIGESQRVPDIGSLAVGLRSCLQESEDLPRDFTQLFNTHLFKFDTNLIPEAVELYNELQVKHDTLTLIPPQFETPMPPLKPATFPPSLKELNNPALDV